MTIDDKIKSLPDGTIFEVYWENVGRKYSRTAPYIFQKINDDDYELLEYKGLEGRWRSGDSTPNWEREGRANMFESNHAVEFVSHGVRQDGN